MSIPREYFDLVEEVRDEERDDDVIVIDDGTDYIPSSDVNDVATNYMDTLRMERGEGEQPVYELVPMPKPKEPVIVDKFKDTYTGFTMPSLDGKDLHVTADTIITLHECDGMTEEFLFLQPSHGEWLEEVAKEVSDV